VTLFYFLHLLHTHDCPVWHGDDGDILIYEKRPVNPTSQPELRLGGYLRRRFSPPHTQVIMAAGTYDVVLRPFRELIKAGELALAHAAEDPNHENAPFLKAAARSLHNEGERALKKITPLLLNPSPDFSEFLLSLALRQGMSIATSSCTRHVRPITGLTRSTQMRHRRASETLTYCSTTSKTTPRPTRLRRTSLIRCKLPSRTLPLCYWIRLGDTQLRQPSMKHYHHHRCLYTLCRPCPMPLR
jgi:hypothetical protein